MRGRSNADGEGRGNFDRQMAGPGHSGPTHGAMLLTEFHPDIYGLRPAVVGTILAIVVTAGCRSASPDVSRVAQAIARADSASRGPLPYRAQVGLEDLPVASSVDSDSVAWVNINQKYVAPKDGPHVIDYGVPVQVYYYDGRRLTSSPPTR